MPIVSGGGGGGGAPTGAAGGDLGGTYPNPTVDLASGGTITGALIVAPASAAVPTALEVLAPAAAAGDTVNFHQTVTSAGLRLDSTGRWFLVDALGNGVVVSGTSNDRLLLGFGGICGTNADGFLYVNDPGYAPSDASIGNSEVAIYFDATNGAPKLKLKGKQADGTVVTASIALA